MKHIQKLFLILSSLLCSCAPNINPSSISNSPTPSENPASEKESYSLPEFTDYTLGDYEEEKSFHGYRAFKTYFDVTFAKNNPSRFFNLFNANTVYPRSEDQEREMFHYNFAVGHRKDEKDTPYLYTIHAFGYTPLDGPYGAYYRGTYFFPVSKGTDRPYSIYPGYISIEHRSGYERISGKQVRKNIRFVRKADDQSLISVSYYYSESKADEQAVQDYYVQHLIYEGNPYLEDE